VARPISKKCVACAQLSAKDARQVHGPKPSGDGCWVEKRCKRRRSYYRHRQKVNERRRMEYRQQSTNDASDVNPVETVSLSVAETSAPYANLYIWREKRKDAPIHAISASVFQDGSKVLEVTVHTG